MKYIIFILSLNALANTISENVISLNGTWKLKLGEGAVECWPKGETDKKTSYSNNNSWIFEITNGKVIETRVAKSCTIKLNYEITYDGTSLRSFNGDGSSSTGEACDESIMFGEYPRKTLHWTYMPGVKLSERSLRLTLAKDEFFLEAKAITKEGEACHYRFVK